MLLQLQAIAVSREAWLSLLARLFADSQFSDPVPQVEAVARQLGAAGLRGGPDSPLLARGAPMIRPGAWGRHWWVWAVPSLVLAANLAWIVGFRTAVLQRGTALESQVEQLQSDVARLETASRKLAETRGQLDDLRTDLDVLRRDQLSGMREPPGSVHRGGRAARRRGGAEGRAHRVLVHQATSKSGLVYFTASYAVKGTYEQIRQCVYLMETSPQFIVLEGLGLRGDSSSTSLEIWVQLTMGTYFSEVDEALIQELGVKEVRVGSQD